MKAESTEYGVKYIKPFFPTDCTILKKTDELGKDTYHHSSCNHPTLENEIRTCDEELESMTTA
jgi:hypothetical protein